MTIKNAITTILLCFSLTSCGGNVDRKPVYDLPVVPVISTVMVTENPKMATVTIDELRKSDVIGELGVPLGQIVEIFGEIIDGDATRVLENSEKYLIKIEKVDGKSVAKNLIMQFKRAPVCEIKIASNTFDLDEIVNGRKPRFISSKDKAILNSGYVGKKFRLYVAESCVFNGIKCPPVRTEYNKDYSGGIWQGCGYSFENYLLVLQEVGVK